MFPSDELIKWCQENREFVNGLWEPQAGDWITRDRTVKWEGEVPRYELLAKFNTWGVIDDTFMLVEPIGGEDATYLYGILARLTWLPRQDQLVEMLEERGYYPAFSKIFSDDPNEQWWGGAAQRPWSEQPHDTDTTIQGLGSCCEIALLETLKEVAAT